MTGGDHHADHTGKVTAIGGGTGIAETYGHIFCSCLIQAHGKACYVTFAHVSLIGTDADFRVNHITIVAIGACVTGRIGDASICSVTAFWQWIGDINRVSTIVLDRSGQYLGAPIAVGDEDGYRAAWNRIGSTSDGRCGVIGIVRRIDGDHWSCYIHTPRISRTAGITRRICHCGCDGIRAFGQGGNHIHGEGASGCDDSGQGLLITVCIGDQQGYGAASGSIRSSGQGRSGVIGIVWRDDGNGRGRKVKYFILTSSPQRRLTIGVVGGIEGGFSDGCGTGTVDGDKTAVATGTGDAPNTATTGSRCTACGRGFKGLGRVRTAQNGLLQGIDIIRSACSAVLCQLGGIPLFGRLTLLAGWLHIERLSAAHETGAIRRHDHRPFRQHITFSQQLPATISSNQINLSFELGYGYALFQGNGIGNHVLS
ncbi:hypothetical protein LHJMPILO_00926 [Aeromonas veronii]